MRLGRSAEPILKGKPEFRIGKAGIMREGKDITIVACGHMVDRALKAARILDAKNIQARVIDLHTPKPIDTDALAKAARETGAILTVEEHTIYGGMGSAAAEAVVETCPVPMEFMGIRDRFGVSGEPDELYEYFGLTDGHIAKKAEELLTRKE
jgi:transketolase